MKAKTNELWLKSLVLAQEFDRYVLEHPGFAKKIPNGAEVVLLPSYDKVLREYNLRNAQINREPGRPLVYIEIARWRPRASQIVGPRVKVDKATAKNGKTKSSKRATSLQA